MKVAIVSNHVGLVFIIIVWFIGSKVQKKKISVSANDNKLTEMYDLVLFG